MAIVNAALRHIRRPAIRAATTRGSPVLAALHAQAWQWAYRDQLPDPFLDELTATIRRREAWRRGLLTRPAAVERTWMAEMAGHVVGFADTGAESRRGCRA